jgi:hypothetical protein
MAKDVAAMYANHGTGVAMQGVVGAPSATAGGGSRTGQP